MTFQSILDWSQFSIWMGGVGWGKNVFVSQREGVVLSILDFESVETSPLFLALEMLFVGKKQLKLNLKGQCPAI